MLKVIKTGQQKKENEIVCQSMRPGAAGRGLCMDPRTDADGLLMVEDAGLMAA